MVGNLQITFNCEFTPTAAAIPIAPIMAPAPAGNTQAALGALH